jgi:hypothetical protein
MTDPAHGWMTLWNFSIEEGSLCMTQIEAKDVFSRSHFTGPDGIHGRHPNNRAACSCHWY